MEPNLDKLGTQKKIHNFEPYWSWDESDMNYYSYLLVRKWFWDVLITICIYVVANSAGVLSLSSHP